MNPCQCGCGEMPRAGRRFIRGHNKKGRIEYKVDPSTGCWVWDGRTNSDGYAQFRLPGIGRTVKAHRYFYERENGPIAEGLVIDHLCRNRACVNPAHLEAVTNRENILRGTGACAANARKTHCIKGRPLAGENLVVTKEGHRHCRECRRASGHRYAAQRRAAA